MIQPGISRQNFSITIANFKSIDLGVEVVVQEEDIIVVSEDHADPNAGIGVEWDPSTSIFSPRMTSCASKDVFDSENVLKKMFEKDWQYCTGKKKFKRFLLGNGKGVNTFWTFLGGHSLYMICSTVFSV